MKNGEKWKKVWGIVGISGEKWGKWLKVVDIGEKLGKVVKSGEKW